MAITSYACTAVTPTGAKRILTPDATGYYNVVLGALNVSNARGEFYPALNEVKALFTASSDLQRRIAAGQLYAEAGHPTFSAGMSKRDIIMRVLHLEEKNFCAHIKEVYLDSDSVTDAASGKLITIFGRVKPHGNFGNQLKESLETPDINTAFSVRSLTEDVAEPSGRYLKILRQIITWDMVASPGIANATKYRNPTMEEYSTHRVDEKMMVAIANVAREFGVGMESTTRLVENALRALRTDKRNNPLILPSSRW